MGIFAKQDLACMVLGIMVILLGARFALESAGLTSVLFGIVSIFVGAFGVLDGLFRTVNFGRDGNDGGWK